MVIANGKKKSFTLKLKNLKAPKTVLHALIAADKSELCQKQWSF